MTFNSKNIVQQQAKKYIVTDMSDVYTSSFPEFVPFCPQLYYFSSFKDFQNLSQA
jgi:hypothetical protein